MRWDRLFDDLEGQAEHAESVEREALIAELREGEWSQIGWTRLVAEGSDVELAVRGGGVLRGRVQFANDRLIHLAAEGNHHVVAAAAVVSVAGASRPRPALSAVAAALGWSHVLRQAVGEPAHLHLRDGLSIAGTIDTVGADFVAVIMPVGATRLVPFDAIRVLTTQA